MRKDRIKPCPDCSGPMDYRAVQCRSCRDKPTAERQCTKCKIVKPNDQFRIRTRKTPRPRPQCRQCDAATESARWAARPAEEKRMLKAISRAKEKKSPAYRLQLIRKSIRLLGLESERDLIMAALENTSACAICEGTPKRLRIDHDHNTGKYRGLLCDNCNIGLGHFKDSPARLRKAISYLKERK